MLPAILIVEDERTLAKNVYTYLSRSGFDVRNAETGREAEGELEQFKPDVVLLDYRLPDTNGLELLARIREIDAGIRVIVMTGEGSVQIAVQAMKAGAYDYLSKPLELKELRLLLERAAGQDRLEGALDYYRHKEAELSGIAKLLGDSPPMRELKQRMGQLLNAERQLNEGPPPSVLITGETGTGKEVVARALHYEGPRSDGAFIEVNCSAIPANLLEAELFGYERGAFTDARERKIGLAEAADGGTLFLDEIGDVEASVQTKLLKLLEDRSVRRLGGLRDRAVDVRIMSATNRPLERLVQEGRFRSDLFFRLRVVQLELPALRERGDDILLLARHFLGLHARRYQKETLRLSPAAQDALLYYAWPGNVRELRNIMEQAVLMASSPLIEPEQLPLAPQLAGAGRVSGASGAAPEPDAGTEALNLESMERRALTQALEKTRGNVTRAASLLGLSRDALRYRIEKYGLKPGT